jgi:hypothetical protein
MEKEAKRIYKVQRLTQASSGEKLGTRHILQTAGNEMVDIRRLRRHEVEKSAHSKLMLYKYFKLLSIMNEGTRVESFFKTSLSHKISCKCNSSAKLLISLYTVQ